MLTEIGQKAKETSYVLGKMGTNLKNAGLLAAKILATSDPELLAKLKAYSEEMKNEVAGKDEKLQKLGHKEYLAQK